MALGRGLSQVVSVKMLALLHHIICHLMFSLTHYPASNRPTKLITCKPSLDMVLQMALLQS